MLSLEFILNSESSRQQAGRLLRLALSYFLYSKKVGKLPEYYNSLAIQVDILHATSSFLRFFMDILTSLAVQIQFLHAAKNAYLEEAENPNNGFIIVQITIHCPRAC